MTLKQKIKKHWKTALFWGGVTTVVSGLYCLDPAMHYYLWPSFRDGETFQTVDDKTVSHEELQVFAGSLIRGRYSDDQGAQLHRTITYLNKHNPELLSHLPMITIIPESKETAYGGAISPVFGDMRLSDCSLSTVVHELTHLAAKDWDAKSVEKWEELSGEFTKSSYNPLTMISTRLHKSKNHFEPHDGFLSDYAMLSMDEDIAEVNAICHVDLEVLQKVDPIDRDIVIGKMDILLTEGDLPQELYDRAVENLCVAHPTTVHKYIDEQLPNITPPWPVRYFSHGGVYYEHDRLSIGFNNGRGACVYVNVALPNADTFTQRVKWPFDEPNGMYPPLFDKLEEQGYFGRLPNFVRECFKSKEEIIEQTGLDQDEITGPIPFKTMYADHECYVYVKE